MSAFPKWARKHVRAAAALGFGVTSTWSCAAAVLARDQNEAPWVDPHAPKRIRADVVVVGAGIAGLACAASLARQGKSVIVFEASHHLGGRVRVANETEFASFGGDVDDDKVVPWHHRKWLRVHRPSGDSKPNFGTDDFNFELGAEFIHGPASEMTKELVRKGIKFHELFTWAHGDGGPSEEPSSHDGGIGMYWDGKKRVLQRYDELDADHKHGISTLWSLADRPVAEADKDPRTLREFLESQGVRGSGLAFAEAGYANTVCGTTQKIGVAGMCGCERNWLADGDGDYRVSDNKALYSLIEAMAHEVHDVRLTSPVTSIRRSQDDSRVLVTSAKAGVEVEASAVVVTVPLPVMQRRLIEFDPPLPDATTNAFASMKCEPALKIMAKFAERPWPANVQGVVCADAFAPEMWFDSKSDSQGPHYVTAFFTSDQARRVSKTATSEAFTNLLTQLGDMFAANDKVRAAYRGGFIIDWGAVPYIWGGYTVPCVGEERSARSVIAAPHWDGKLLFAGEAYNPQSFMTAHAAFDAGFKAASSCGAKLSDIKLPRGDQF